MVWLAQVANLLSRTVCRLREPISGLVLAGLGLKEVVSGLTVTVLGLREVVSGLVEVILGLSKVVSGVKIVVFMLHGVAWRSVISIAALGLAETT